MIPAGLALLQPRSMYMLQTYANARISCQLLMQENSIDAPLDSQESIGQRIKFLIDDLQMSIRKLARTLDVSDTNIRNYIERGSKPSSDVLERIMRSFPQINSLWLLTGQGEPFLPNTSSQSVSHHVQAKKNYGNIAATVQGSQIANQGSTSTVQDLEKQLEASKREIELLKQQLVMAQGLIAAKDETLTLLRASRNNQN